MTQPKFKFGDKVFVIYQHGGINGTFARIAIEPVRMIEANYNDGSGYSYNDHSDADVFATYDEALDKCRELWLISLPDKEEVGE